MLYSLYLSYSSLPHVPQLPPLRSLPLVSPWASAAQEALPSAAVLPDAAQAALQGQRAVQAVVRAR